MNIWLVSVTHSCTQLGWTASVIFDPFDLFLPEQRIMGKNNSLPGSYTRNEFFSPIFFKKKSKILWICLTKHRSTCSAWLLQEVELCCVQNPAPWYKVIIIATSLSYYLAFSDKRAFTSWTMLLSLNLSLIVYFRWRWENIIRKNGNKHFLTMDMLSACIDPLENLGKSEYNGWHLMDSPWWKGTAEKKYKQEVKRNTWWTYGLTKST